MRIVIDLQACQSSGSRTRGIGRYSLALAQAMVRNAGSHEIFLLMNGMFADTIAPLREQFAGLVPHEQMRVWHTAGPVRELDPENHWRCRAGEILREQAIAELRPDFVHVTSLFEGLVDNAVASVGASGEQQATAVTLYDLIPLIYQQTYLPNPHIRDWYFRKLQALKSADLSLAISESSRQEAIHWLHMPPENVVNISSAVDDRFHVATHAPQVISALRTRYGLTRPFVMYTGGIDHRKNIDALIRAFGALPGALRQRFQLAIVCSVNPSEREIYLRIADLAGLTRDDVVFTGFVPDADLPVLYNICELFVFPSWHEGFGLPALEAMACGAPVIGANTSSLPEVIGLAEAMFDPRDDQAITASMVHALSDAAFREHLRTHGLAQAKKFSWDASARVALAAIESSHARNHHARLVNVAALPRKRKLAYFSPLPPLQSGIADYSVQLILELARYYEIDVFVAQTEVSEPHLSANFTIRHWQSFEQDAGHYERILYHLGNSVFHSHMFDLIERHPGVVVLHDFFMSGILSHLDLQQEKPGAWSRALYASHGYHALLARKNAPRLVDVVMQYPCNSAVIDHADGVIVHSEYSLQLARTWYRGEADETFAQVPLMRGMPLDISRDKIRGELALKADDFLVCSFGGLGETKLNHRLLRAWLNSPLAQDPQCHLVFVGVHAGGDYGDDMLQAIAASRTDGRIRITGFAEPATFRAYLTAADAGVQLRTMSRGETSAAVLDCMSYGLPTIINAHAAMAELPSTAVLKLPDDFSDAELIEQLLTLRANPVLRQALASKAMAYVRQEHSPAHVGLCYANAIERFAEREPRARRRRSITAIANITTPVAASVKDLQDVSSALSAAYQRIECRTIWIDVTAAALGESKVENGLLALLAAPPQAYRIEPVFSDDGRVRFARQFTCKLLDIKSLVASDDGIEASPGDVYVGADLPPALQAQGIICVASIAELEQLFNSRNTHALCE